MSDLKAIENQLRSMRNLTGKTPNKSVINNPHLADRVLEIQKSRKFSDPDYIFRRPKGLLEKIDCWWRNL